MPKAKRRTTRTAKPTSEVDSLKAQLAEALARLDAVTQQEPEAKTSRRKSKDMPGGEAGRKLTVSEAQATALGADDFHELRMALVAKDEDGDPIIERIDGKKRYKLIDGAKREWYMACRGFETTLNSNGELSSEPNDDNRTQVLYAREILSALTAAGFINLSQPKAKGRKSA